MAVTATIATAVMGGQMSRVAAWLDRLALARRGVVRTAGLLDRRRFPMDEEHLKELGLILEKLRLHLLA